MAIRRCPYCKAIIDEQDKYCNNCGTQLLFPEDEYIEEEIPGDKIVEEPEEEEGATDELEEEEELEEPEEEEEDEEAEDEFGEEEETDEDLDELEEPSEEGDEEEIEEAGEELEFEPGQRAGEGEEVEEKEEIERPAPETKVGEFATPQLPIDERDKKYRVSIEEDELVFKTKELEGLTDTVEEGKGKLEEFFSSFQKEKPKAVTPHEVPALFQEEERTGPTTKEILPPWAKEMKEEKAEEAGRESMTTPTHPEWATDSGIGIPEKVTQPDLSFGPSAAPATAGVKEAAVEEEKIEEELGAERRGRISFSLKLKSKLVDLVLITALWLISLWFTAQVIGVSFFRLIAGSPGPVLVFYFILLVLYFFLFLFFLGETLGDHYFSEED